MILRSTEEYIQLFKEAGYKVVKMSDPLRFKEKDFECQMFALQVDNSQENTIDLEHSQTCN